MAQGDLFDPPRCKPTSERQDAENAAKVEEFLGFNRGWVSARWLAHELGVDDRAIRAAAAASDGRIISGQQGYKLTRLATREELEAFVNPMQSQARKMQQRAVDALVAWNMVHA
jgi:hypothetical protein